MTTLNIESPKAAIKPRLTPFALGFRPFFLVAGISAVLLMLVWLAAWPGRFNPSGYYDLIGWHSHEMLFGYVAAVIAGFLLTAVRNWTGIDTWTGARLAGLVALWLAGRVLALAPAATPPLLIALIDIAFIPALLVALFDPLIRGEQKANRIFIPLLIGMSIANLLVHLQLLAVSTTAQMGISLMLNLVLLLVVIIGGRVIPFFTQMAVPGVKPKTSPLIEIATFSTLILLIVAELAVPDSWILIPLAGLVALTLLVRLLQWHHAGVWSVPILAILFIGYAWLVLGFALKALAVAGLLAANLSVHAFTVGGVAVLTLGMMARVALGHTGRPIQSARIINIALVLLILSAIVRVFGPLAPFGSYIMWVHLSGGLWMLSFILFIIRYAPILLRSRIDGRPG